MREDEISDLGVPFSPIFFLVLLYFPRVLGVIVILSGAFASANLALGMDGDLNFAILDFVWLPIEEFFGVGFKFSATRAMLVRLVQNWLAYGHIRKLL